MSGVQSRAPRGLMSSDQRHKGQSLFTACLCFYQVAKASVNAGVTFISLKKFHREKCSSLLFLGTCCSHSQAKHSHLEAVQHNHIWSVGHRAVWGVRALLNGPLVGVTQQSITFWCPTLYSLKRKPHNAKLSQADHFWSRSYHSALLLPPPPHTTSYLWGFQYVIILALTAPYTPPHYFLETYHAAILLPYSSLHSPLLPLLSSPSLTSPNTVRFNGMDFSGG